MVAEQWRATLIGSDSTVQQAIESLDRSGLQIVMVTRGAGELAGTVTDGDIRRGILRGNGLDAPVERIMNRNPTTIQLGEDPALILALMRAKKLHQVPVVDHGRVVGLETLEDLISASKRDNDVVFMAGGFGKRLMPLTANMPKPMLPIAGRPILEHALVGLAEQGFHRFHLAINYLGDMVEQHFGDGSRWGVSISYLRETQPLGTAGALSLMPERPEKPFLVMNGDILTKLNFLQLMDAHEAAGCNATMCVRHYDHQIPFGVTRIDGDRLVQIEEKPTMRHFVSAGIYVVEPRALDRVPQDQFLDMPQLLSGFISEGKGVQVFPITEYWLDVGRHDDMQRAIGDFGGAAE
jgi:dTDP-glucose pyrophosphorylase/predicted transcriptional regulator